MLAVKNRPRSKSKKTRVNGFLTASHSAGWLNGVSVSSRDVLFSNVLFMSISVEDITDVFREDELTSSQEQLLWERGQSFVETLLWEASNLTEGSLRIEAEAIGAL